MIYVRKLVLVDEDDRIIYKVFNQRADKALNDAIQLITHKDTNFFKSVVAEWDNAYVKIFNIGGKNED